MRPCLKKKRFLKNLFLFLINECVVGEGMIVHMNECICPGKSEEGFCRAGVIRGCERHSVVAGN